MPRSPNRAADHVGLVIDLFVGAKPADPTRIGRKVRDDCEHHNYQGDWEDLVPTTFLFSAESMTALGR
jgi:hypothetical protein